MAHDKRKSAVAALLLCCAVALPAPADDAVPGRIRGAVVADLPAQFPIRLFLGRTHADLILGRYMHAMEMPTPGPFVIDDVPPGSYVIGAFVDMNYSGFPERDREPYAVRREPFVVAPGQDTEPVLLDHWFHAEPQAEFTPEVRDALAVQVQALYEYIAPRAVSNEVHSQQQLRMQTQLLRLRNVAAWAMQPGTEAELQWLMTELQGVTSAVQALEAGEDPGEAERGPVRRAIRSVQHNSPWPYALYVPHTYNAAKSYPLFVVLHGAGGNSDSMLITACGAGVWGQNVLLGRRPFPEFPPREAFVVAPFAQTGQAPWDGFRPYQQEVLATIDTVIEDYSIDEKRVYLTGVSMGGGGTWRIGLTYPDRFAAIAPLAATLPLPPEQAGDAPELPVVVYHGEFDHITDIARVRAYVQQRENAGGNATLHELAGTSHYLDLFGMDAIFAALEAAAAEK